MYSRPLTNTCATPSTDVSNARNAAPYASTVPSHSVHRPSTARCPRGHGPHEDQSPDADRVLPQYDPGHFLNCAVIDMFSPSPTAHGSVATTARHSPSTIMRDVSRGVSCCTQRGKRAAQTCGHIVLIDRVMGASSWSCLCRAIYDILCTTDLRPTRSCSGTRSLETIPKSARTPTERDTLTSSLTPAKRRERIGSC